MKTGFWNFEEIPFPKKNEIRYTEPRKRKISMRNVAWYWRVPYIYMAHRKVNSPKHLKDGEIFFETPPQNRTKMPFFAIFFTYSY